MNHIDSAEDCSVFFLRKIRINERLNREFFEHLKVKMVTLRLSLQRTKEMDDWLAELEALHRVLSEGLEANDKMTEGLIGAKDHLARILASKDKKKLFCSSWQLFEGYLLFDVH